MSYVLLTEGQWCDNVGGAQRIGNEFARYTLASCQNACTQHSQCAYISYDAHIGWCSIYATCGVPTDTPNRVPQDATGWSIYTKSFAGLSADTETEPVRSTSIQNLIPREPAPVESVSYTLIAEGKWCNNLAGAQRIGAEFDGYTLLNCQGQCTRDGQCAYISFNSNDGWCSKYATCGTPTDKPNPFLQDSRGWFTYKKMSDEPFHTQLPDSILTDEDCDQPAFQTFKTQVATWYERRISSLALFRTFSMYTSNFEVVFNACAPAALLALLLKLECVYFEEGSKWEELLQVYIERQHRAVSEGTLAQKHHTSGWPLSSGIDHVMRLRALGHRQGIHVTPHPSVNLVICYCAERLSWLRAFHKLPWRDEDRSSVMRNFVSLHIYHKCGGFGIGVREGERKQLIHDWRTYFKSVSVRYVDDVLRADDDSAYMAYIADSYDNLPEFSVFLHADAPEHIPTLDLLTDTVFAAARGYLPDDVGFVHFAHNYVLHEHGCQGNRACEARVLDGYEFPTLWKNVFGSSIAPSLAAGHLNAYCCVQFLIRRSRILLRPKAFYEHGLKYFGTTAESYHRLFPVGKLVRKNDVLGRTPGQLAMYIWHVMFGESLKLPRRQRDPRLPLFMKVLNIEVEVLTEEESEQSDAVLQQIALAGHVQQSGEHSIASRLGQLFET